MRRGTSEFGDGEEPRRARRLTVGWSVRLRSAEVKTKSTRGDIVVVVCGGAGMSGTVGETEMCPPTGVAACYIYPLCRAPSGCGRQRAARV